MTEQDFISKEYWWPYASWKLNVSMWIVITGVTLLYLIPCGFLWVGFNRLTLPWFFQLVLDTWFAFWWLKEIATMIKMELNAAQTDIRKKQYLETIDEKLRSEILKLSDREVLGTDPLSIVAAILDIDAKHKDKPKESNPFKDVLNGTYRLKLPPMD